MRKIITSIMLVCLIVVLTACSAESANSEYEIEKTETEEFIVASTTELDGDFMNGWSHNSQTQAVINLLTGYSTYEITSDQTYKLNEVAIKEVKTTLDDEGNKTYTFTLNDNLFWNNGDKITAKDYVFSILLTSSPEFSKLDDANNNLYTEIVGQGEFSFGETKIFEGVHLIDSKTFSMTISYIELPNFYENILVSVSPLPMAVIAPKVYIIESEEGTKFSENFTLELIEETILNKETGYRYNPKVTCGPYSFVSYNQENSECMLELNNKFLGRAENGGKGTIEQLLIKPIQVEDILDGLETLEIDLIPSITGGNLIKAGLDVASSGKVNYSNYDRAGYGKIEFACDFGPTQFAEVRQAVTYCIDRVAFLEEFTGGYGNVPNSWYSQSQWEYQYNKDLLEEKLNPYGFDLEKAEKLLIDNGWTLNSDGEKFVKGKDDIRYKMYNGDLMPLVIKWAATENSIVSSLLEKYLLENTMSIGMKIEETYLEFDVLLEHLYREKPEQEVYNMFNLATGFGDILPTWYYSSPYMFGIYNTERIDDEELFSIALNMKNTDPSNKKLWAEKWLEYQIRYNELMVNIPLYSDEYYDFYNANLKEYNPNAVWSWEHAILKAEIEQE